MDSERLANQLPLRGRRVLVVEDSAVQREHAVSLARELGAALVLEATNGLEGLSVLAGPGSVDLVLADLEMPVMDGITFIGEAAARGFRPDLIVTSSQDASVIRSVLLMAETYGLKVLGMIQKPMRRIDLLKLANQPAPSGVGRSLPGTPGPFPEQPLVTRSEVERGLKGKEFLCFFQPQVTFQGALLRGVEALVRWQKPGTGLLGPAAFLAQAEMDEGLMADLTMAILDVVADQWHGWRRQGLDLEVSVNLSATSISCKGFGDALLQTAERLGLPPKALVFELTESASIKNLGHTLANLSKLRMRGFKLSIDDFGTGFATYEQLERIPFTELKLDRSIVMHLPHSARHVAIARSMVNLSQGLNLTTVAEGVETLETWQALRAMGCECGQGYLIARPMPGDHLLAWAQADRSALRSS